MERSESPIISTSSMAVQLNSKLPIHVMDSDLNDCPDMNNLLIDLTSKINPNGTNKQTSQKLQHSASSMKRAREKYFEENAFHYFLSEILLNQQQYSQSQNESLTMTELLEALTISELQNYTDISSLSSDKDLSDYDSNVFRLLPNELAMISHNKIEQRHLNILIPKMNQLLNNQWNQIQSFISSGDTNSTKSLDEICDLISSMKKNLTKKSEELKISKAKNDIMFHQVYSQMCDYGMLLLTLIENRRLSNEPEISLNNLYVASQAQYLKLRCMESEILCKTYNSSTVPALKVLHSNLEKRNEIADKSLIQLSHKLDAYTSLDPKFISLSEEYKKLCQDIEFWQTANSDKS